jgi:ribonuclease Z
LEILFLGTGSGITSLKRDHSSFLITYNNFNLLTDCGEGISKALLKNKIGYSSIDAILISHFHPDHVNGISNLLNQMKLTGRKNNLKIYLHHNLLHNLRALTEISNIYLAKLGFNVILIPFEENEIIDLSNGLEFISRKNSHFSKQKKYYGINETNLVSLSFLFSVNSMNIVYTGDIGGISDLYLFENSKIDIFISEITHISLSEINMVIKQINPGKLILTHIADETESELIRWQNSVNDNEKIITAFDGYKLEL